MENSSKKPQIQPELARILDNFKKAVTPAPMDYMAELGRIVAQQHQNKKASWQ